MAAKVSDYKNSVYHREFSNDIPLQKIDLVKRVAAAALPFIGLHSSLRAPLSAAMGSLRLWNAEGKLDQAIAVVSLASGIFKHPLGQMATTAHDIVLEATALSKCDNSSEALKHLAKILNNLLHLALISRGGLELSILSLAMQAVINLMEAKGEFGKDRWIEGCANVLMAAVRVQQMSVQCQQLKRNWEIEAAMQKIYVGMLHEKWQFPSDHLPVGVEVNGVRIISWNVLNNISMDWVIEKDSQGLNGSMITQLNVPVANGLTIRDLLVAEMIHDMMAQGHVIALQECSAPFVEYLQMRLPSDWGIVASFDSPKADQGVILYNTACLSYRPEFSETTTSAYPCAPNKWAQKAFFTGVDGKDFRVINTHIPGDPTKPGREEFAQYVARQPEGTVTIALGDNNFERDEMMDAYRKAGFSDFSLHSPWKTNIDPYTKESKGIDHLFITGAEYLSRDLRADEILQERNLQETIHLLNP